MKSPFGGLRSRIPQGGLDIQDIFSLSACPLSRAQARRAGMKVVKNNPPSAERTDQFRIYINTVRNAGMKVSYFASCIASSITITTEGSSEETTSLVKCL